MPGSPLLTLFSSVALHMAHCAYAPATVERRSAIKMLNLFIFTDNKGLSLGIRPLRLSPRKARLEM